MNDDVRDDEETLERHPGNPNLVRVHVEDLADLRPGDIITLGETMPSSSYRPATPPAVTNPVLNHDVPTKASKPSTPISPVAATLANANSNTWQLPNIIVTIRPTCRLCDEDLTDGQSTYCPSCREDIDQYTRDASGI